MARTLPIPSPGQIARVRQRLYLVEDIVVPPLAGESTLVRLSCIDDDNQGQPLEVLWERELDPAILNGEAWASIAQRRCERSSCPGPRPCGCKGRRNWTPALACALRFSSRTT